MIKFPAMVRLIKIDQFLLITKGKAAVLSTQKDCRRNRKQK